MGLAARFPGLQGAFRLRVAVLTSLSLVACAGASTRPGGQADDLSELRSQLTAQSALIAQQQRRLEDLEIRLAAIQARGVPAAAPKGTAAPAQPARFESKPQLKTVKLGGRRPNPVERAPRLPSTVALKEPDEDALARLEAAAADPSLEREASADFEWAQAIRELNAGDHARAETDLLAFAAGHPGHTAADNALYFAGLVREARGDCASALALFESVGKRYPAGDAVPMAELELGRCHSILGRRAEAKEVLSRLVREHAGAPEAVKAQALLLGL